MKNILIFGKNGQVGSALVKQFCDENEFQIQSYSSKDIDFSNLDAVQKFLDNLKTIPNIIINAAAYTAVDKAEEEKELVNKINHQSVAILAKFCANNDITLIHYSTDYIFDGSGDQPFIEDNIKNLNPLNHYGKTKLDGENAIINSGCNHIILRTSWIWSENGKNFVNTIKKLAQEREELNIIDDQIGSPTFSGDIANYTIEIIKKLLNNPKLFGIYNLVSAGYVSWFEFAKEIIKIVKKGNLDLKIKEINPIPTTKYKTPAKRPLNSRLNINKIQENFNIKITSWKDSLKYL